jgi:predicted DNA-binding protein (UPF0251 family)
MTPEQFQALAELMRLRPSDSREALRLVLIEGLTHAAAAERCNIQRPGVTRLVSSARKVMQRAQVLALTPS